MEDMRTHDRAEEAVGDDTGNDSGDRHMTTAEGRIVSENYYTALQGDAEEAWTEDSSGGPSEATIIKSPQKPRQKGSRGRQNQEGGTSRLPSGKRGVAEVKGRKKMDSGTMKNIACA
jgi:hypothetical protein